MHISFAADEDIGIFVVEVGEEVEGKDYATIAAVFKGYDAPVCGPRLDGREDVFDCDFRCEGNLVC
jgi:hypothetical protein